MGHTYAVLGAGRQGTAAAFDLVQFGESDAVILADVRPDRAQEAADRVDRLTASDVARAATVDVRDEASVARVLDDVDVVLSAVPYFFNLDLARMAVRAGVSMVDLGGHTGIVREELTLGPKARDAGVAIVPDCGMAPGMNLTLAAYGMELLHRAEHVFILEGGLPQDPRPPWSYELTFNVEGLTNEYTGVATFLRNGRLAEVPALTELETLDAPGLGPLEAIVTSGGLSTAPWSFHGILTTLQNKTLRHPGHWAKMIAFRDLGLFDTDPVKIDGARVVPRHVFHALFEPQVTRGPVRDVCAIFVRVIGRRGGSPAAAVVNLIDRYDEVTGFTAMERLTGWHGAIVAEMIAAGWIPPGAHPVELGVPPRPFVREALKRGLVIDARLEPALKVTA